MSLEYVSKLTSYYNNRRFKQAVAKNYLKVFESNFETVNVYDIAVESFYSNLDDVTIQIKDIVKKTLTQLANENDDQVATDVAGWYLEPFPRQPGESEDGALQRKKQAGNQVIQELQQLRQEQELIEGGLEARRKIVEEQRSEIADESTINQMQ